MRLVNHPKYFQEWRKEVFYNIDSCSYFIGIYAYLYGTIHDGDNKSITQLEYEYARDNNKTCFVFFHNEDMLWYPKFHETKPKYLEFLNEFKKIIKEKHSYQCFDSEDNLVNKVNQVIRVHEQGKDDKMSDEVRNKLCDILQGKNNSNKDEKIEKMIFDFISILWLRR